LLSRITASGLDQVRAALEVFKRLGVDHVFGNAVAVAVRDFRHRDHTVHGALQVGVIGADTGGDDHLQPGCLVPALGRHVSRPERQL